MVRMLPTRPSALAVAAWLAGVAAPALAQVNGPGQVYSTAPRAGDSVTGGYAVARPAAVPPAVVVVPAQAQGYGPARSQRPPAIQTAPNVVLGWGGLPPSTGQPAPGYAAPGYAVPGYGVPGYAVPGYGYPAQPPGVQYGGQVYPSSPYGQPVPQVAPPPVYYPAPYR